MTNSFKHLCFDLGEEEFSIPLLEVKEVLAMPEFTKVPQTPPHFLGIMNLRGQVISVIDLRSKLAIKSSVNSETSVIILDLDSFYLGVVVDRVNSVQEVSTADMKERPSLDSKANDYVVGVFEKNKKMILNLDIRKALSIEDKNIAMKAAKAA